MRVILKPLGLITLCASLVGLSYLAFYNYAAYGKGSSRKVNALVYDNELRDDWSINGWATTIQPDDTTITHRGKHAIRTTIDKFLGVKFMHTPMPTGNLDRISFFLNGGEKGRQRLHVQALLSGEKTGQRVVLDALPPNRWVCVTIPLKDLQVDNKPDLTHFWLQDTSGVEQPECFIDDVRFLSPGEPAPEGSTLMTSIAPRENW